MTVDFAQALRTASLLPAADYADAAAINAAAVAVDTQLFRSSRAIVILDCEDAGADTTISVEHSDASGSGFSTTGVTLSDPKTDATDTMDNLNTAGVKTIAIDLAKTRRYIRIQAATDMGANTVVSAILLGEDINVDGSN